MASPGFKLHPRMIGGSLSTGLSLLSSMDFKYYSIILYNMKEVAKLNNKTCGSILKKSK